MPVNPKPSCGACRFVKEKVEKLNNNTRKHILIYAFFYILAMEVGSLFLQNKPNYLTYWFPLLCQFGFAVVFYALWLYRKNLKFCLRKDIAVFFLFLYYLFNGIVILFQICNSIYTNILSFGFLGISLLLLLTTILAPKK